MKMKPWEFPIANVVLAKWVGDDALSDQHVAVGSMVQTAWAKHKEDAR